MPRTRKTITLTPEQVISTEVEGSQRAEIALAEQKKYPPGSLGLPPYLDSRRIERGILKEAFEAQCTFYWVNIWPMAMNPTDRMYEGSSLVRPMVKVEQEEDQTPVGLICGAGLAAMDLMYSHGMKVGDVVRFCNPSAYRIHVSTLQGREFYVYPMKVGDIMQNFDISRRVEEKQQWLEQITKDSGEMVHIWRYADGCSEVYC
jgi:hypothetical protein